MMSSYSINFSRTCSLSFKHVQTKSYFVAHGVSCPGIHIKGEDVSLFDTVNGKCIERTTFDAAPDSWQDRNRSFNPWFVW